MSTTLSVDAGEADVSGSLIQQLVGVSPHVVSRLYEKTVAPGQVASTVAGQAAVYSEGNTVQCLVAPNDQRSCSFDSIVASREHLSDVYGERFYRLAELVVNGFNASVLVFGDDVDSKEQAVFGDSRRRNGLLPAFGKSILQQLERNSHIIESDISFEMVEFFDDAIVDLMNPESHVSSSHGGRSRHSVSSRNVSSVSDLVASMETGLRHRNRERTEFGSAYKFCTIACMLRVSVCMRADSDTDSVDPSVEETPVIRLSSVLSLVMLPDISLHTSDSSYSAPLRAVLAHIEQLSRESSSADALRFVDVERFRLTRFLADAIGGNAVTIGLFMINTRDPRSGGELVTLARRFKNLRNFPIANDERARGLLISYALRMKYLRMLLAEAGSAELDITSGNGAAPHVIQDIKARVVKENLEKLKVQGENDQLKTKLGELRSKYTTLLEEKMRLQNELLRSEEERLQLSKKAIDMQIERDSMAGNVEESKFAITNRLIEAEQKVIVLRSEVDGKSTALQETEKQLRELEEQVRRSGMELTSLRDNLAASRKDLAREKRRNEEIGVEMLNLVNQKNELIRHLANKGENVTSLFHGNSAPVPLNGAGLNAAALTGDVEGSRRLRKEQIRARDLEDEVEYYKKRYDDLEAHASEIESKHSKYVQAYRVRLEDHYNRVQQFARSYKHGDILSTTAMKKVGGQIIADIIRSYRDKETSVERVCSRLHKDVIRLARHNTRMLRYCSQLRPLAEEHVIAGRTDIKLLSAGEVREIADASDAEKLYETEISELKGILEQLLCDKDVLERHLYSLGDAADGARPEGSGELLILREQNNQLRRELASIKGGPVGGSRRGSRQDLLSSRRHELSQHMDELRRVEAGSGQSSPRTTGVGDKELRRRASRIRELEEEAERFKSKASSPADAARKGADVDRLRGERDRLQKTVDELSAGAAAEASKIEQLRDENKRLREQVQYLQSLNESEGARSGSVPVEDFGAKEKLEKDLLNQRMKVAELEVELQETQDYVDRVTMENEKKIAALKDALRKHKIAIPPGVE